MKISATERGLILVLVLGAMLFCIGSYWSVHERHNAGDIMVSALTEDTLLRSSSDLLQMWRESENCLVRSRHGVWLSAAGASLLAVSIIGLWISLRRTVETMNRQG